MSFFKLSEINLGDSSSVTVSNFNQEMNHIYLLIVARSSVSAVDASLRVRFNNDSGTNYSRLSREVNKTQTTGYVTGSNNNLSYVGDISIPGANGLSSTFSHTLLDIFDYNDSSRYTFFNLESGNEQNTVGKANYFAGMWKSTSTVSSITIYESSNATFVSGSRALLYGYGK